MKRSPCGHAPPFPEQAAQMSRYNLGGHVLAICGRPGAGKTTLAIAAAEALGRQLICHDDFETMTERPPEQIADWLARGAPVEEMPVPGLRDALLSASRPVVLDTPVGVLHPACADQIGVSVWLDCSPDRALARKLLQYIAEQDPGAGPGFGDWMTGFLAHHLEFVAPLLEIQEAQLRPRCDLILNADQPQQAVLDALLAHLSP